MRVVLFGGSGFVGRALSAKLMAAGHEVSVASRVGRALPGVRVVEGDPLAAPLRVRALAGSEVAVNLIGILHGKADRFHQVHVELAEAIAESCIKLGVPRLVHMSALHADPGGPSLYLKSKGEGEAAVHALGARGLEVISVRPSVIFGAEDGFLNRFAKLLRIAPGVMLLPGARARFAPVYVGDVAKIFVRAIEGEFAAGTRLDLCGPQDYTLLELVRQVAKWSGHRRLILPMPERLAQLTAGAFELLPSPPLTRDNLASMRIDSVCPLDCPRQMTRLEDVAPTYLGGRRR
ncbi:MAG: complex I NDUFA9 subunit family protein [Halothiobacillaceae bacterium]|jgi:NADH dehydrogenase